MCGVSKTFFFANNISLPHVRKIKDKVGARIFSIPQPVRQNITSLLLLYPHFYRKCSDEVHSLVPPVVTFTCKTSHTTHMKITKLCINHLHFLQLRCKFYSSSFFLQIATLWNQLPRGSFPDHYNLKKNLKFLN